MRARQGVGQGVAVGVGRRYRRPDRLPRVPVLGHAARPHRVRLVQARLHRVPARRLVAVAGAVHGCVRGHVGGHRSTGIRPDLDLVASPRAGERRHRTVAHRHVVPREAGHRLREGDRHVEGTGLNARRTSDGHGRSIQVRLGRVPARGLVAVAGAIGGRVRRHVHGHGSIGRRSDRGPVGGLRTGESGHRTVGHRHVVLLEAGHVFREGDRHLEGAGLRSRRPRDADRGSLQVRRHRVPARGLVAVAGAVGGCPGRHIHGHGSAGRRRDPGRVTGARTGESGHQTVADRHVLLIESRDALREGDRHVEGAGLVARRTADGHGRSIHVRLHGVLARRPVAPAVAIDGHAGRHVHRHRATARRPDGGPVGSS